MVSPRKLRVGIIGLGIGAKHATSYALVPEAELIAVADPAPGRLKVTPQAFAAHFGARYYADGVEMMEKERLDAVSICTSPIHHRPLVEAAARRGIHILMEKPMAGTNEDCDGMVEVTRRAGVQFHMEFPMRQLPPMVELKRVLEVGTLGRPFMVSCDYVSGLRTPDHWIWKMGDGSSPVNENTCHGIDCVRYLLGDVDRIYAEAGNYIGQGPKEVPDAAAFTMHHVGGGISTVVGGACATNEMETPLRVALFATEGQAVVDGFRHTFHRLKWANRQGETFEQDWGEPPSFKTMLGDPFARYTLLEPAIANFVRDCLAGVPPRADIEDGRQNVRICLAVLESAKSGRPVDLRQPVVA